MFDRRRPTRTRGDFTCNLLRNDVARQVAKRLCVLHPSLQIVTEEKIARQVTKNIEQYSTFRNVPKQVAKYDKVAATRTSLVGVLKDSRNKTVNHSLHLNHQFFGKVFGQLLKDSRSKTHSNLHWNRQFSRQQCVTHGFVVTEFKRL